MTEQEILDAARHRYIRSAADAQRLLEAMGAEIARLQVALAETEADRDEALAEMYRLKAEKRHLRDLLAAVREQRKAPGRVACDV